MMSLYPKQLIPLSKYYNKLDIDILLKYYPALTVVRQVEGDSLPKEFIRSSSDVVSFSMNLLGGKYKAEKHLPFLPKSKDATKPWDGYEVNLKEYPSSSYTITSPCVGAFFKVSDIHNILFPFKKSFSNTLERDEFENRAKKRSEDLSISVEQRLVEVFVNKSISVDTFSITKVTHAPVQLNYWHITLDILPIGSEDVLSTDDRKRNSVKTLAKLVKMHLYIVVNKNIPENYRLLRKSYVRMMNAWDVFLDMICA